MVKSEDVAQNGLLFKDNERSEDNSAVIELEGCSVIELRSRACGVRRVHGATASLLHQALQNE